MAEFETPWLASSGEVLASSGDWLASGGRAGQGAAVTQYARPLWLVAIGLGGGETLYLASEGYTSPTADGAQLYAANLSYGTAVRYRRELSFWPWRGAVDPTRRSGSSGTLASGQIEIANDDGRYDYLADLDLRDQPVTVSVMATRPLGQESTSDTAVVKVEALVNRVRAPTSRTIVVELTDPLSRLDRPLQTLTYGDDADDALIDRPQPVLLGVARNIRPLVYDGPNLEYRVHDSAVSGIGVVRDKGIALNPLASPAQWTFNDSATGFVLDADPVGVVTVDASTVGDAILPPSPTDELGGNGFFSDPFTGTFDYYGTDPAGVGPDNTDETAVALPPGWTYEGGFYSGGQYRILPRGAGAGILLINAAQQTASQSVVSTATLSAGATYRLSVRVFSQIEGGNPSLGQFARLTVRLNPRTIQRFITRDSRDPAGLFTGNVTIPAGVGPQSIELLVENTRARVEVGEVEAVKIVDTPVIDLEAITLENYAREVALQRARVPAEQVDLASFAALDDAVAGGTSSETYGIGVWLERPSTVLDTLRLPLDSYGADLFSTREGVIKAVALQAPELLLGNASAVVSITETDIALPPQSVQEIQIGGTSYFWQFGQFDKSTPNHINATRGRLEFARSLARAINGTGRVGPDYSSGTAASAEVVADEEVGTIVQDGFFVLDTYYFRIVAREPGTAGNSITGSNTEDFTWTVDVPDLSGGVGDGSTALSFGPGNIAEPPRKEPDTAPGLTSAAEARLNWYQFRDGDFADNTTDIPLALRQQFVNRGQLQVSEPAPALKQYAHAEQADPIATVFDSAPGAQAALSRVLNAYGKLRNFYTIQAWLADGEEVEPGDVVTLEYPRYGLDIGKPALVVGVDDTLEARARRRLVGLKLWA